MSGYVEAGYVVALVTLATYAASLRRREITLRQRLGPRRSPVGSDPQAPRPSGVGGRAPEEDR